MLQGSETQTGTEETAEPEAPTEEVDIPCDIPSIVKEMSFHSIEVQTTIPVSRYYYIIKRKGSKLRTG